MKLSLIDKLRILSQLNTLSNNVTKGVNMKNSTVIVTALFGFLTALVQIPDIQHAVVGVITSHPALSMSIAGITSILSILHDPKDAQK